VTALAGPPLAVATAVLALFPSSASMLAVQPLIAISFSMLFVGQSRLLAAAVPSGLQASAQTLGSALTGGVGGLIAGVVGGRVADSLGYGGLFGCLVVLATAGSAVGGLALLRARRSGDAGTDVGPVACRDASPGCTVPANQ
jgi:MFS family permease